MTIIFSNRVALPHGPLADPAGSIAQSLANGVLMLQLEAEKRGLDVDWETFTVNTETDYLETSKLPNTPSEDFEIRTNRMRVRAQRREATS